MFRLTCRRLSSLRAVRQFRICSPELCDAAAGAGAGDRCHWEGNRPHWWIIRRTSPSLVCALAGGNWAYRISRVAAPAKIASLAGCTAKRFAPGQGATDSARHVLTSAVSCQVW